MLKSSSSSVTLVFSKESEDTLCRTSTFYNGIRNSPSCVNYADWYVFCSILVPHPCQVRSRKVPQLCSWQLQGLCSAFTHARRLGNLCESTAYMKSLVCLSLVVTHSSRRANAPAVQFLICSRTLIRIMAHPC